MRWSRVVCGWGACLALCGGPARAQAPVPAPSASRAGERDFDGRGADEDRLAQVPPAPGTTAPPAAPGAPPTPSPAPPAVPGAAPTPTPPAAAATPPAAAPAAPGMLDEAAQLGQVSSLIGFGAPEMFGDRPPTPFLIRQIGRPPVPVPPPPVPPPQPPPGTPPVVTPQQVGAVLVPSVRGFKIADNQSPKPTDRLLYSFNYFEELNKSINRRIVAPISNIRAYRHVLGLEKTFLDRRASIGFRLPINTLSFDSPIAGLGGTSTAAGDLNLFAKYVLWQDQDGGNLVSAGMSVTAPTGPSAFAGARRLTSLHNAALQPFVGYILNRDRLYAQGFFSVEVPTSPSDVTIMYNDFGVGYFVYRAENPDRLISAVAPTFEVHVNTPLNHRGFNLNDPAGTPDFVDFTQGVTFTIRRRARLLFGITQPVTGPRPFDFEALALLNVYF